MTVAVLLLLAGFSLMAQPSFVVRVDTLFVVGNEAAFDGYSFELYHNRWCFSMSNLDPAVLYEDDLYTVSIKGHDDIIFTEKQPSWYIDSHNGWPQYEYVNRQHYFPERFYQILRNGGYYYFVYKNKVDSLNIGKGPGNPLVHKSKWCDPISGYGGWVIRDWFCCLGCGCYPFSKPIDTTYCGAFVADNHVYYLLDYDKEIFIAQRHGDNMTNVLDLGTGWSFDYGYNWWNLGPGDNRLMKPFHTTDGTAGLLTIDGNDIHVQYVMSPKTVVP